MHIWKLFYDAEYCNEHIKCNVVESLAYSQTLLDKYPPVRIHLKALRIHDILIGCVNFIDIAIITGTGIEDGLFVVNYHE